MHAPFLHKQQNEEVFGRFRRSVFLGDFGEKKLEEKRSRERFCGRLRLTGAEVEEAARRAEVVEEPEAAPVVKWGRG